MVWGQLFLGQQDFVETIRATLRRTRQLPEVTRQQRYADRPSLEVLFESRETLGKTERDGLIAQAHLDYGYSLLAISQMLGLHYTTISKVVKARLAATVSVTSETSERNRTQKSWSEQHD